MAVAMLASPLVASVNAKPAVATVEIYCESWPNVNDLGDKLRLGPAGKSDNQMIHGLNIVGNGDLIDPEEPPAGINYPTDFLMGNGGVRLTINDGINEYVLTGRLDEVLLQMVNNPSDGQVVHKNTWTILSASENAPDGAEGSTLEVLGVSQPGGGLTAVGTRGTGIFEGAKFKGTYASQTFPFMTPVGQILFRIDTGSGELMFK
jgi:hypothetical protein